MSTFTLLLESTQETGSFFNDISMFLWLFRYENKTLTILSPLLDLKII